MIRKTAKKPKFFEIDGEKFKTERLGYVTSAELLLTYAPVLLKLQRNMKSTQTSEIVIEDDKLIDEENEEVSIDLSAILDGISPKIIGEINEDLLEKTYVATEDGNGWEPIDPQDFEGIGENAKVIVEVFKFNFPDFFKGGNDSQDVEESEPTPNTAQFSQPKQPEILKL